MRRAPHRDALGVEIENRRSAPLLLHSHSRLFCRSSAGGGGWQAENLPQKKAAERAGKLPRQGFGGTTGGIIQQVLDIIYDAFPPNR